MSYKISLVLSMILFLYFSFLVSTFVFAVCYSALDAKANNISI